MKTFNDPCIILQRYTVEVLLRGILLSGCSAHDCAMASFHSAIPCWEVSTSKAQVDAPAFLNPAGILYLPVAVILLACSNKHQHLLWMCQLPVTLTISSTDPLLTAFYIMRIHLSSVTNLSKKFFLKYLTVLCKQWLTTASNYRIIWMFLSWYQK